MLSTYMQLDSYYPFGMMMVGRSFSSEGYRFGFNGKENDNEVKGAGTSLDFGARIYDSRVGRWLSLDPLQQKYPFFSPYGFTLNNPIIYIDPDGRKVIAVNDKTQNVILNTLTKEDAAFVVFDENGVIDQMKLNQANSNSGNFEALKQLVNDERTFEVNVTKEFKYKNENGDIVTEQFGPIYQESPENAGIFGPSTGEEGWTGVNQTPGIEKEKYNSPDENIKININEALSEKGQAETFSHEGYGHAYLYSLGEKHTHEVENMTEMNKPLKTQIIERVKEAGKNFDEKKGEK